MLFQCTQYTLCGFIDNAAVFFILPAETAFGDRSNDLFDSIIADLLQTCGRCFIRRCDLLFEHDQIFIILHTFTDRFTVFTVDERGLWYDSSIDIFGGKIGVNSETSAFLVPDSHAAEKYVCSTVGKSCTHYSWYKLNAYKLSESQLTADVITFEIASTKGSAVGSASPVMMVDGIRAEKDESGEIIYKIAGYVNGNATELAIGDYAMINDVPAASWVYDSTSQKNVLKSTGSYTIKKGDLIQYQLDANNMVADARILCTYNKTNKDFDIFGRPDDPRDVTTDYNGNDRAIRGWVYQTDGIFFNVSHASKREDITPLSGAEIYPVISSIGVYVYYPSTDTVKVGGMSDFLSYSQVGTACSRVVAFMTGSDMMAVVLLGE